MATLADGSFRAEFSLQQTSAAPAIRFLCGCRDCAFRREEARLAESEAVQVVQGIWQQVDRILVSEEA